MLFFCGVGNQDKLKFVPVHEQVVTDEEGRRRFVLIAFFFIQ